MKCPYCAETILDEALKCRFCGEWIKNQPRGFFTTVKNVLNGAKQNASKIQQSLFGYGNFPPPTDNDPFQVNDELKIGASYFEWLGKRYSYNGVYNFSYVLFDYGPILENHLAGFSIRHKEISDQFTITGKGYFIRGKAEQHVSFAIHYIRNITYGSRLTYYLESLNKNGSFVIEDIDKKNVTLFADGKIQQNDLIFDLRQAHSNGVVRLGFSGSSILGHSHSTQPHRIYILDDKNKQQWMHGTAGGTKWKTFTKKNFIEFTPVWDVDIIFAFLSSAK